ncbi:MAG: Rieske 2Fe-2S domain-containing protein [Acidimicrobiia bacterium]|nr:Rieske 2Fe-2S domain-containing protein [Acidimicrobiia bacterium]
MAVAIAIAAILIAAAAAVLLTQGRLRSSVGALSRETRRRDAGSATTSKAVKTPDAATTDEHDEEAESAGARARAGEARSSAASGLPAVESTAAEWSPVDEEELGVTRRQFFNRGIVAGILFATAGFGASALAFIWPSGKGGFGGKISAGKLADILAAIDEKKAPFYVPEARSYVTRYPTEDIAAAKKAGYPSAILPSLEDGFIVEYQKCPHLGCRVPWCGSSQWFECPCHGSKYNRVGEKRDGPAPRGMSLVAAEVSNGDLVINTGIILPGLPIGTDSTKQKPEGPSCI